MVLKGVILQERQTLSDCTLNKSNYIKTSLSIDHKQDNFEHVNFDCVQLFATDYEQTFVGATLQ
jgi:hypothetical protein